MTKALFWTKAQSLVLFRLHWLQPQFFTFFFLLLSLSFVCKFLDIFNNLLTFNYMYVLWFISLSYASESYSSFMQFFANYIYLHSPYKIHKHGQKFSMGNVSLVSFMPESTIILISETSNWKSWLFYSNILTYLLIRGLYLSLNLDSCRFCSTS